MKNHIFPKDCDAQHSNIPSVIIAMPTRGRESYIAVGVGRASCLVYTASLDTQFMHFDQDLMFLGHNNSRDIVKVPSIGLLVQCC